MLFHLRLMAGLLKGWDKKWKFSPNYSSALFLIRDGALEFLGGGKIATNGLV